jgi:integrase
VRRREVVAGQIDDPRRTTYETLEAIIRAEYALKQDSVRKHLESYLRWLRTFFGGKLARDITRADLIAYVQARRATPTQGRTGAADNTIKLELAILRRAMRLAVESGRMLSYPKFPTIETYPRQVYVRADEVEAVLRLLPAWWVRAFEAAWIMPWRFVSEILTRTWADVDWQAGVVRLWRGQGKKRRERAFPITERLRDILVEQRAHVDALERELGRVVPWVFPGPAGERQKYPWRAWHTACRHAGVVGKLPHDLRRTYVRDLQLAGVTPAAGMAATGHKDERTYRGYAGADDTLIRHAVDRVEELRRRPAVVVPIRKRGQTA